MISIKGNGLFNLALLSKVLKAKGKFFSTTNVDPGAACLRLVKYFKEVSGYPYFT